MVLLTQDGPVPESSVRADPNESEPSPPEPLDSLRVKVYDDLRGIASYAQILREQPGAPSAVCARRSPAKATADARGREPSMAYGLVQSQSEGQIWPARPSPSLRAAAATKAAASRADVSPVIAAPRRVQDTRSAVEGIAVRHARLLALSPSITDVMSRTFAPLAWVRSSRLSTTSTSTSTSTRTNSSRAEGEGTMLHAVVPDAHLGMSTAEQVVLTSLALP